MAPSQRLQQMVDLAKSEGVLGIVCRGKTDGGGAQLHARASALAFSRAVGVPLFFSPLQSVDHGAGAGDWVSRWEHAIDFQSGMRPFPPDVRTVNLDHEAGGDRAPRIISSLHFHEFCDAIPNVYNLVREELYRRCRLTEPTPLPVLAVHIRRGNVAEREDLAFRQTPMERTARLIRKFRERRPELAVHVFSQGATEDFRDLPDDCRLHLDEDIFDGLRHMINASALIMAKSSLSYLAGLLCRGEVVYEDFWHPKLNHWRSAKDLLSD